MNRLIPCNNDDVSNPDENPYCNDKIPICIDVLTVHSQDNNIIERLTAIYNPTGVVINEICYDNVKDISLKRVVH